MTFAEALNTLKETRTLNTELLRPLGITFENFLRFSQLSGVQHETVLNELIAHLEALAATSNIEAFTARNR
jgi:hypothetical protein